jgi:hypothetical protein
VSGIKIKE